MNNFVKALDKRCEGLRYWRSMLRISVIPELKKRYCQFTNYKGQVSWHIRNDIKLAMCKFFRCQFVVFWVTRRREIIIVIIFISSRKIPFSGCQDALSWPMEYWSTIIRHNKFCQNFNAELLQFRLKLQHLQTDIPLSQNYTLRLLRNIINITVSENVRFKKLKD